MELAPDITAEDLKVFLEEAEEQLQLLDEDIIRLENEGNDESLLQEIFRAAHTLKGSSAMVGHNRMAELAHAMENLLDKVRKGQLVPTGMVIDALLHSLDGLRALNEELTIDDAEEVDISLMIGELAEVVDVISSASECDAQEEEKKMTLGDDARDRLQAALLSGQQAYKIHIELDQDTGFSAVRCFQILMELAYVGEVITSSPSQKEVEEEEDKIGYTMEVIVTSSQDQDYLKGVVMSVPEIDSVTMDIVNMEQMAAEEEEKAAAKNAPAPVQKATDTKSQQIVQAHVSQTVRIDVERLDTMMNMIGELVISTSRMTQIGKTLEVKYSGDEIVQELGRSSAQTTKVVSVLQEDIMKIRMLPVGTVFSTFPRMVRDLAQKSKKKVNFIIEGQDTGIDRTVIEHIRDPLIHLLRNSVDHGIETVEERKTLGKPETATLRLSAYHEEGRIVITVDDDGKGIDAAIVKQSAVKKGFISGEDVARMSDEDAIDLIFGSGLSTKEQATEVSGRGVGLDVVRKNIESLNGYVGVETKVGVGTRFILRLPLTLATLDSLLVTCSGALYALPIVNVLETVRLQPWEIKTVSGREVIRLRGGVLPLLRLSDVLELETMTGDNVTDLVPVVIVRAGDKQVGLAVDAFVEKQEIVVKSLGERLGDVLGISGASILGDGKVALIIDVPSLIKLASIQPSRV